ncbi:MAG: lycopene cyclase domain-containing protein [Spirochaetia bacterium]|nr:lycopene cyclase domain-containing protein [Spirochaetia bacterium]
MADSGKPIWEIEPAFKRDPDGRFYYDRGSARYPGWALVAIPFIIALNFFVHAKGIDWGSVWMTVMLFLVTLGLIEHLAIYRGYWVYNEARLLGPKIFGVPIEEWVIYYIFPPILVVSAFEYVSGLLKKKSGPANTATDTKK